MQIGDARILTVFFFFLPASERLNDAEACCASDQQKAQHNSFAPNAYRSQIYAAGTEFALGQAVAQLMGAVVGVLNESLTESIRGFYKLRKAYMVLDGILKMEEKFIEDQKSEYAFAAEKSDPVSPVDATVSRAQTSTSLTSVFIEEMTQEKRATGQNDGMSEPGLQCTTTTATTCQVVSETHIESAAADEPPQTPLSTGGASTPGLLKMLDSDPDSEIFKNEVDVFVHSGANCCFGVLLLLISMVPPTFSKVLGIIGFHGDKHRGLRMLWQASKFHNLLGAIAALALLGYYNGLVRYCDIMPDTIPGEDQDVEGYPRERLVTLLTEMRKRFPDSKLWLVEESRMEGANKNLRAALSLLQSAETSALKQVDALRVFEMSMNAMYLHEYELCSASFLEVCSSVYIYIYICQPHL